MDGTKEIYKFLQQHYPLKSFLPSITKIHSIKDIISLNLSHLNIELFDYALSIDLTNATAVNVQGKVMSLRNYLHMATGFIRSIELFRLMDSTYFPKALLPELSIESLYVNGKFVKPQYVRQKIVIKKAPSFANHFILNSFSIYGNSKQLSSEINRLIRIRDNYSTLHFHLENNNGGDLIPVHVIMRYLCGSVGGAEKESWMKEYSVLDSVWGNYKIDAWSPWCREHCQYEQYTQLNIKERPLYKNKYTGNIVIHVNEECASSTWFFITYLIYAFASSIERKTIRINGTPIKVGKVKGLSIHGYSSITSGDGNAINMPPIKEFNYTVFVPTQQFIESPVKSYDYNRFWLPT